MSFFKVPHRLMIRFGLRLHQMAVLMCISTCSLAFSQVDISSGFTEGLLVTGFDGPTSLVKLTDGRFFVAEKGGQIRVIEQGKLLPEALYSVDVGEAGEQGLGSILLDPHFEENGFLYLYYTVAQSNFNRLSRIKVAGNLTIPASEVTLMEFDTMPGKTHQGGAMRFLDDGTLILATGDGNMGARAQEFNSLLGKVIRIRSDGTIPEDNPFYGELSGKFRSIYALGLRNPFSLDYDRVNKRVYICDVGDYAWEEINELSPGANFGWPQVEGPDPGILGIDNYQDPVYAYEHGSKCAILGAAFYRSGMSSFPNSFEGKFFFSDACTGEVFSLDPDNREVDWFMTKEDLLMTSILVDSSSGRMYYLNYRDGQLRYIDYINGGIPRISEHPQSMLLTVGENFATKITATGTRPLHYTWTLNGSIVQGQTSYEFVYNNVSIEDSGKVLICSVVNSFGYVSTDTVYLKVTENNRPKPFITLPSSSLLYGNGDTLVFEGVAMDPEDGELPVSNLKWKIDFHHDDHAHPAMPWTEGIKTGSFITPRLSEVDTNVFYRIFFEAVDLQGHSAITYTDIHPTIIDVAVNANRNNIEIIQDGHSRRTPFTFRSVKGNTRVLLAQTFQIQNDSLFRFSHWNDGVIRNPLYFDATEDEIPVAHYDFVRLYDIGQGNGLLGTYFDNINFEGFDYKKQIDTIINFNWDWDSPIGNVRFADSVSIKWEGQLLAPIDGRYTFVLEADIDDYVTILIDGDTLIHAQEGASGEINLEGGKFYDVQLFYAEPQWRSRLRFMWKFTDNSLSFVPKSQLYTTYVPHSDDSNASAIEVFPNPSFGELTIYAPNIDTWEIEQIHLLRADGVRIEINHFNARRNSLYLGFSFEEGLYYVNVRTKKHLFSSPVWIRKP